MKTIKMKTIMFMVLGALLFNSCAKDNTNQPSNEGVMVKFTSTLGSNLKTASVAGDSATTWLGTDQIGIYMVNDGTTSIVTGSDNVLYITTPNISDARNANFSAQSNTIYYPVDASQKVNFIAYYPYSINQTSNYSYAIDLIDQSASTSQADNDLLYANDGTAYNKNSGNVNLKFQHVLAKILLNILPGDGLVASDLANMTVTMGSLQTNGTFDLATAALSVTGTAGTLTANTTPDGSLAQAILLPQTTTFSINFVLINGDTYTWTPSLTTLKAATQYTYNVKISRTAITAVGTITNWTMQSNPSTYTVN